MKTPILLLLLTGFFPGAAQAAPPVNDDFSAAAAISATSGTEAADTNEATAEAGEAQIDGASPQSVWYQFTAPQAGKLTLTLNSTSGDPAKCAVFTGSTVNSLTTVSDYSTQHKVFVALNDVLYVAVSTPVGQHGTSELSFGFADTAPGEFEFSSFSYFGTEWFQKATLTVFRSNGEDGAVTIPFTITPDSATTADYVGSGGNIQFADGETFKDFDIGIVDDLFAENSSEFFTVTLGAPSAGELGANSLAIVTIDDFEDFGGGGGPGSFYIPDAGYSGLTNSDFTQTGSGFIQFRVANAGRVTGKLSVDGLNVPFKGQFIDSGSDANLLLQLTAKRGREKLNLTLSLNMQGDGIHISGTLSGASPTPYAIAAERDAIGSTTLPLPQSGNYNSILTGTAIVPGGGAVRGIARLSVKPNGAATLAGVLPDGQKFKAKSKASLLGALHFAADLYKKEQGKSVGYIAGSLTFDANATPKAVTGGARWNKPANNGAIYPNGVDDAPLTLTGGHYTPPSRNQRALADFEASGGDATAMLTLGNLAPVLSKAVNIGTKNNVTVTTPDTDKLKLAITPATGLVTGSFKHTDGRARKIFGILVQSSPGFAQGLFTGTDEAGILEITPAP